MSARMEDALAAEVTPRAPRSGRDELLDAVAGMVADLEGPHSILAIPDIARRMRELHADLAALTSRDL